MKPSSSFPLSGVAVRLFAIVLAGTASGALQAAVIDLRRPVSDSLTSIDGIYWAADVATPEKTTPDSSANGYTGNLREGGGTAVTLVAGVDREGTSGFGNAIRLATSATAPGGSGNPRISLTLPSAEHLGMAGTSFSGGAWLNFNSLLAGNQTISVIERGIYNTNAAHWGFRLSKSNAGLWQMIFQTGDGNTRQTVSVALPETVSISTNQWHHFGFSYAYGTDEADNVVTFWMDGVNQGTAALSIDIAAGSTSSELQFVVGERGTTSYTSVFDGTVDDIFVTTGWHSFQPIPEPSTYAMGLLGAMALLTLARRQKREL